MTVSPGSTTLHALLIVLKDCVVFSPLYESFPYFALTYQVDAYALERKQEENRPQMSRVVTELENCRLPCEAFWAKRSRKSQMLEAIEGLQPRNTSCIFRFDPFFNNP